MANRSSVFLALCWLFLLSLVAPGFAQPVTLWEIGKLDKSAAEFHAASSDRLVYEVGKSNWARDWPGQEQPGAAYEIRFGLEDASQGVFSLTVSTITGYMNFADLQVEINGHKGTFYVRPTPLSTGDNTFGDVMIIELPTRYMKTGENRLLLSAVGTQPVSDNATAGAQSIRYDFIGLTHDTKVASSPSSVRADLTPTVFYRQNQGMLLETVEGYLHYEQPIVSGQAVLFLNGKSYRAEIPAGGDFGEKRVEFEVPEWHGPATAKLKVTAGVHQAFDFSITPERKWVLYVVPHTHLDVGYTDYQGKVAEIQADTLMEAADLIKEHPDFRFTPDGSWNLQQVLETRSPAEQNQILNLIRTDKMGLPADYVNILTGYASLETLYRSLYYSKKLSLEHQLPFDFALITDVPAYTWAYPSVLASAGIKYWAAGANQDRRVLAHEQWNDKSPFWWVGPDGQKVLFDYSWGYSQMSHYFTVEPTNALVHQALPQVLALNDKPDYKPDAVLVYGAQGENADLHPQLASFASVWNRAYAYPKLQLSTFSDFFRYIDRKYGAELPTYKGDMGPTWEDGVGADAFYSALDRHNQGGALSAEIVSTAAHTINPGYHPPRDELEDAWSNIELFAEHSWGASNSVSQPESQKAVSELAVKDNFADQAHIEVEDITNRSLYQLARWIRISSGAIVAFNGLSWKRDALIEADLRKNQEIYDLTSHEKVPFEVLSDKQSLLRVRFLAKDLPSVGYRCFQVQPASDGAVSGPATETNPVIENTYYRITIDAGSGAVQSIYDKQLQREIVDAHSPYRFGQYLYVTGNGGNDLAVHPAVNGEYLGAQKTPWGYSIKLRSSDVNTPEIGMEILLFDHEKKIEFSYTVHKTYTDSKEAVYFAFPAAVQHPEFAYAIHQGWVDPARDMLPGASTQWFSIQKWMAVRDERLTVGIVPVDAFLANFGDINRGWPNGFHPATSTIFSYAMNNYWHTNYRGGQGGTFTFRYVLTTAQQFDPVALTRMGIESMEPPVLNALTNQDKVGNPNQPLPPEGTSFLDISAANVVLVTWKLAEDGKGTILRLQETGGRNTEAAVHFSHTHFHSASLCNAVEDTLLPLAIANDRFHVTLRPHQVVTVRLMP